MKRKEMKLTGEEESWTKKEKERNIVETSCYDFYFISLFGQKKKNTKALSIQKKIVYT